MRSSKKEKGDLCTIVQWSFRTLGSNEVISLDPDVRELLEGQLCVLIQPSFCSMTNALKSMSISPSSVWCKVLCHDGEVRWIDTRLVRKIAF